MRSNTRKANSSQDKFSVNAMEFGKINTNIITCRKYAMTLNAAKNTERKDKSTIESMQKSDGAI